MLIVLLFVHMALAVAIVGLVLIQRSEGGGLGIGGGTMGGLMSVRSAGNFLTRTTGIVMGLFFATSLGLALLSGVGAGDADIFDRPSTVTSTPTQPETPASPADVAPSGAAPTAPSQVTPPVEPTAEPAPAAPAQTAPTQTAPTQTAPAAPAPAPAQVPTEQ